MNEVAVYSKLVLHEQRYDPTRTLILRNNFVSACKRRFRKLTRLIREAIVTQDVFGLKTKIAISLQTNQVPPKGAFVFPRTQEKITSFMEWLRVQIDHNVLEIGAMAQTGRPIDSAWTDMYVLDSYKRGVIRGRLELKKAGIVVPSIQETGGIYASMNTPFHLDRVGVLYTRVFEGLKGITASMDTQISRVLAQGLIDGDGPALLARKMQAVISSGGADLGITDTLGRYIPAERRAMTLARTEVIRAHHMAMIQEYRNWGVEEVKVQAEWTTAGDGRVCSECSQLEGKVYTLDEIENMIPLHPNCRCLALPVVEEEEEVEKVEEEDDVFYDDPAIEKEYRKYEEEYLEMFTSLSKEYPEQWAKLISNAWSGKKEIPTDLRMELLLDSIREKANWDGRVIYSNIGAWQTNAQGRAAYGLRQKVVNLERSTGKIKASFDQLVGEKGTKFLMEVLEETEGIPNEQYLRMRAMSQAYMKKARIKEVILHRGIGGDIGKEMAEDFRNLQRELYPIAEMPLSGWSSDWIKARSFGDFTGGVTMSAFIPAKDIFMHTDLIRLVTGRFYNEFEFFVISKSPKRLVLREHVVFRD